MHLNFKQAFTFMFKDKRFLQKFLIGLIMYLLTLLPVIITNSHDLDYEWIVKAYSTPFMSLFSFVSGITSLILWGYFLILIHSNIKNDLSILPEWKNNIFYFLKIAIKFWLGFVFLFIPAGIIDLLTIGLTTGLVFELFIKILLPSSNIVSYVFVPIMGIITFTPLLLFLFSGAMSFCIDLKIKSYFKFKNMFTLLKGNFKKIFLLGFIYLLFAILINIVSLFILENSIFEKIYFIFYLLSAFYLCAVSCELILQIIRKSIKNIDEFNCISNKNSNSEKISESQ